MTIDNEPAKSYHYPNSMQSVAGVVSVKGKPETLVPLNPEEIAEYIHTEHTPYSIMSLEDSKKNLAELIQQYSDYELQKYKVLIELP